MKKTYNAPQMTVHGNVEHITQAYGDPSQQDLVITGGSNVEGFGAQGSTDGVINPT